MRPPRRVGTNCRIGDSFPSKLESGDSPPLHLGLRKTMGINRLSQGVLQTGATHRSTRHYKCQVLHEPPARARLSATVVRSAHADISTTANIYAHLDTTDLETALKALQDEV
jgi:hypothetical protein